MIDAKMEKFGENYCYENISEKKSDKEEENCTNNFFDHTCSIDIIYEAQR